MVRQTGYWRQVEAGRGCQTNRKCLTFWPVSMVMARPLGTNPAVLCFFTSRTDTTGIHTWTTGTPVSER